VLWVYDVTVSFPKISFVQIRAMRQNQRIIRRDACDPPYAGNVRRDMFKSRRRPEAENLFLRHQLTIALRQAPSRLRLHGRDRALLVWIKRIWPNLLVLSQVVKPETILRWHRAGFKAFWRWIPTSGRAAKDRSRITRPHPADEQREPVVGRPAHPRRAAQAWLRGRRVNRLQIHDQTPRTAIADVADIPAQPCGYNCRYRSLPGSDPDV
jgi:hypothetical protein